MNINETFPSNYVKASDLNGRDVPVTVSHVVTEKIGNDAKPVIYFQGKQKGVVLNKTNAMTIASAFGPETDTWNGRQLILMPVWTDYQGKQVQAIRVRPSFPNNQAPVQQQQPSNGGGQPHPGLGTPPAGHPAMNDDIPF